MRTAFALILGSTLFAVACSSSPNNTTGTTGTTSGGTTTGSSLLAAGKACSSNAACASNICGIDGTGNCCSRTCTTGDASCGATACDNSGSCTYPSPSTSCGASTCVGTTVTPAGSCNGQGTCHAASSSTCPNNLACVDGGVCATTCASQGDCAPNFSCNGGVCGGKITTGPCTENDDCTSGFCGANGRGNCCSAQCASTAAACAASDCDATSGACIYPAATVACGSVLASCTGSTQQDPSLCDGAGNCNATPATVDCTPFICGATACLTNCTGASNCAGGGFCDAADATCCPGIPAGSVIAVDSTHGSDSKCCGIGSATPCATITKAMKLIDAAGATNVTISATVADGGADWAPAGEVYPIKLGWGVELQAPGIYFSDTTSKFALFDITKVSTSDTGAGASIFGTEAKPVWIGVDSKRETQSTSLSGIQVEAGNTLYIASATVNGNPEFGNGTAAITVVGGGSLVLGQDQSGINTGTVIIGGPQLADGYNGIVCTSAKGLGCTITDAAMADGGSSVIIQNQEGIDIDAEDHASITLTSSPVIGVAPLDAGFLQCPSKDDGQANGTAAVLLNGGATVTFKNGSLTCIAGDGFVLQGTATASPSLTVDNAIIENTDLGIYVSAGTATVTRSSIQYNGTGVEQDVGTGTTGTIDLGGGGNTVVCCNSIESDFGIQARGACVLNTSSKALDATNTTWDTTAPDVFLCDANFMSCTCAISSCTVNPGDEGMDAVNESDGGTISTTGNSYLNADCSVPVEQSCGKGQPCPPGEFCCNPFGLGGQCIPQNQICAG